MGSTPTRSRLIDNVKQVADAPKINWVRPVLYAEQAAFVNCRARYVVIEAATKAGKAQPLDAIVYTPNGPVVMGDIKVGMQVCTPTGVAMVNDIFPQGVQDVYAITFSDGSVAECTQDHLWLIYKDRGYYERRFKSRQQSDPALKRRSDYKGWPRVMTLGDIQKTTNKERYRMWIPMAQPAVYESKPVSIDPYLLGVLLGDGGLTTTSIRLSSSDQEILDSVSVLLPDGYALHHAQAYDYVIVMEKHVPKDARLTTFLKTMGLWGKGSHEKFIPKEYLYNSTEVRWSVLQGLLDTDGSVDKHGQPIFEQTSQRLASDVIELVESLGGSCLLRIKENCSYIYKGERRPAKTVYRLRIRIPSAARCFRLFRKKHACRDRKKPTKRTIRSIALVGQKECQCISISDLSGLYLTNRHIVTHNTVACLVWLLEQALKGGVGKNYYWVAPVSDQANIAFSRLCIWLRTSGFPDGSYNIKLAARSVELANGSTIWFKSADKEDSLYGDDVYAAVLDEATRCSEASWHAVRSTLTKTRGPIRFIGNVTDTKNWVYKLARRAEQQCKQASCKNCTKAGPCSINGWKHFKLTAYDAVRGGVLAIEEVEDAKAVLPTNVFEALYLAKASDESQSFFKQQILDDLSKKYARPPLIVGDILYSTTHSDNTVTITAGKFISDMGGRLSLWCDLVDGRPDQTKNYAAFCDIGEGVFAANSVCYIADVETNKIVAGLVSADLMSTDFAEYCVALWRWFGGKHPLMAGWEANGPGGPFGRRVWQLGYGSVLGNPSLTRMFDRQMEGLGWRSTADSKRNLLSDFRLAMSRETLIIPDVNVYKEAERYVYYAHGGIGPDGLEADVSGARAAHGDRIIAAAGLPLVIKQQPLPSAPPSKIGYMSMEWFDKHHNEEQETLY